MTDAHRQVLVEWRAELDVRELLLVAEQTLGGLVESLSDMVERILLAVFRVLELHCEEMSQTRVIGQVV